MPQEDMYGGGGPTGPEMAPDAEAPAPEEKNESANPTALVNSDMCPGMKVGDTMQVRIVAVHDKEYEIQYEPEAAEEASEGEAPAAPPAAGSEMYGG